MTVDTECLSHFDMWLPTLSLFSFYVNNCWKTNLFSLWLFKVYGFENSRTRWLCRSRPLSPCYIYTFVFLAVRLFFWIYTISGSLNSSYCMNALHLRPRLHFLLDVTEGKRRTVNKKKYCYSGSTGIYQVIKRCSRNLYSSGSRPPCSWWFTRHTDFLLVCHMIGSTSIYPEFSSRRYPMNFLSVSDDHSF